MQYYIVRTQTNHTTDTMGSPLTSPLLLEGPPSQSRMETQRGVYLFSYQEVTA